MYKDKCLVNLIQKDKSLVVLVLFSFLGWSSVEFVDGLDTFLLLLSRMNWVLLENGFSNGSYFCSWKFLFAFIPPNVGLLSNLLVEQLLV